MGVVYEDKSGPWLKKVEAACDAPGGALDAATLFLSTAMAESMPGEGAAVVAGTGGDTGRRAKYIPSTPGQPPGVRTNRLRGSMAHARIGTLRWAAGTNVSYAKHLEFGTSKMAARPFMRPALYGNTKGILKVFNARFAQLMKVGS